MTESAHRRPGTPAFGAVEQPERIIRPGRGRTGVGWAEVWRYRELLYFLTWRDVKVRYKQTILGAAWAILQPLMTMVVFTLIFGRLGGMAQKTGGVPYPLFVFAGLLPWTFFAGAITSSANSVIGSERLITKIYFPRLIIPLAAVAAGLVDFAVASLVLVALMALYGTPLSPQLLLVPLLLGGSLLAAAGVGAALAALTVSYRDFRYVVPFMLQLWFFLTPVIYPVTLFPERWRWFAALNPMAGLIEGFRGAFLARPLDWPRLALALAVSLFLFLGGAAYFRSAERRFADVI